MIPIADPPETAAPPRDPAPPRTRLRRAARLIAAGAFHLGLAAAAFTAVAVGVRQLVPWPREYGLRAKVEYFLEHKDEFDTVYFGSSLTQRGLMPAIVDRDLALNGVQQRSFSLAVQGMFFYEMNHLIDVVLASRPARLRTVVVEAGNWHPNLRSLGDQFESRTVFWHSWRQTRRVIESLGCVDMPVLEKLDVGWAHVRMMIRKVTNYGQAGRIMRALFGDDAAVYGHVTPADLKTRQGYQDPDVAQDPDELRARERFLASVSEFQQQVEQIDPMNESDGPIHPCAARIYRRQVDEIASRGYRTILLLPAATGAAPDLHRMERAGLLPELVNFNSPGRYPLLYTVRAHFDRGHLNSFGAEYQSHALASELLRRLAPEQQSVSR